jgi:hypothetical protein
MPTAFADIRRDPLDIFVHIPKTAGSTLNTLLLHHHAARVSPRGWKMARAILPGAVIDNAVGGRWLSRGLARGCSHLELHRNQPRVMDRLLGQADWVSGHFTSQMFEAHMARIGRPARYVSLMRDPTEQVASHYHWWIEIFDRGPLKFYRYNSFARDLSRRIRATDNTDPKAIIPILAMHWSMFLNLQSTYLLASPPMPDRQDWWRGWDRDRIAERLGLYAAIGLDHDIAPAFHAVTGSVPPPVPRVNKSRSRLDRAVFRTPEMQEFLAEANACDNRIYAMLKARTA